MSEARAFHSSGVAGALVNHGDGDREIAIWAIADPTIGVLTTLAFMSVFQKESRAGSRR